MTDQIDHAPVDTPTTAAFIADASAGVELLQNTASRLLANLHIEQAFVDLSTPAGVAIATALDITGIAYDIPDVEANEDHQHLADHAARVVEMPTPDALAASADQFIMVLGQQHLVDDEDEDGAQRPVLAEPADSPVSALTQKVAERMYNEGTELTKVGLRLVMPIELGSRMDRPDVDDPDQAGSYRIVQVVSVDTEIEDPEVTPPAE